MDPVTAQTKALLLLGACVLAGEVEETIGNTSGAKNDPSIADPGLQGLNTEAAQEVKVFYNFLRLAFENSGTDPDGTKNGWQAPVAGHGVPTPSSGNLLGLIQFLSQQPPTAFAGLPQTAIDALNAAIALIPKPAAPPSLTAGS